MNEENFIDLTPVDAGQPVTADIFNSVLTDLLILKQEE